MAERVRRLQDPAAGEAAVVQSPTGRRQAVALNARPPRTAARELLNVRPKTARGRVSGSRTLAYRSPESSASASPAPSEASAASAASAASDAGSGLAGGEPPLARWPSSSSMGSSFPPSPPPAGGAPPPAAGPLPYVPRAVYWRELRAFRKAERLNATVVRVASPGLGPEAAPPDPLDVLHIDWRRPPPAWPPWPPGSRLEACFTVVGNLRMVPVAAAHRADAVALLGDRLLGKAPAPQPAGCTKKVNVPRRAIEHVGFRLGPPQPYRDSVCIADHAVRRRKVGGGCMGRRRPMEPPAPLGPLLTPALR